jgi:Mg2+ and Co2+ transporter CorA
MPLSPCILSGHPKRPGIHGVVEGIEEELRTSRTRKISDLTASLNRCNWNSRYWDLDQCWKFDLEAIEWMRSLGIDSDYENKALDLLQERKNDHPEHPDKLRERIAEVRAMLKEEVILQQQEQSSELQRKNVEQQEQIKRIQEESFKLTERLAKEAEKDRLANRAREKANAELTKLSTSIARQSLELARETRRDSRTMRGIGWVTMGFLPATFVASFFGMNFFTVTEKKPYFESSAKSVWIFFLVAVPISAVVLWQFHRWDAKSEKEALLKEGGAWKKIEGRVDESA